MSKISLPSHAKINWNLHIGEIQKNGLHALESEFRLLDLHDIVEIEIKNRNTRDAQFGRLYKINFQLINPQNFDVPETEENIVVKAAEKFFEMCEQQGVKIPCSKISITLTKNIPSGAGLGGGSSNAAAILRGLEKLFFNKNFSEGKINQSFLQKYPLDKGFKNEETDINMSLQKIAADLGSDVPFFFAGYSRAKITGTGEKISSIPNSKNSNLNSSLQNIVLIKPKDVAVPTPRAYQLWDNWKIHKDVAVQRLPNTGNNFEQIIYSEYPEIGDVAEKLQILGANPVRLCGSGATVFGVFESKEEAKKALGKFDKKRCWRCVTKEK